MSADELTVENFVAKIKAMDNRERGKVKLAKLLEIICAIPDEKDVGAQLADIRESIGKINTTTALQNNEIVALKTQNDELVRKNSAMKLEIDLLKLHAKECVEARNRQRPPPPPPPPTVAAPATALADDPTIKELRQEIETLKTELNNIQQYLRVNNLEIVGLPKCNENESEETLLLHALNTLEGMEDVVRPEDIDISHPLNSKRKDGKNVHVVRFVSRKTKNMILSAKKSEVNKQLKFRNNDIYINEHLSINNRSLFARSQEKKTQLNYRFCWTRGGSIFMRKTETSQPITITSDADLANLQ